DRPRRHEVARGAAARLGRDARRGGGRQAGCVEADGEGGGERPVGRGGVGRGVGTGDRLRRRAGAGSARGGAGAPAKAGRPGAGGGGEALGVEQLPEFLSRLAEQPIDTGKPKMELRPDWRTTGRSGFLVAFFVLFCVVVSLEWGLRRYWGMV